MVDSVGDEHQINDARQKDLSFGKKPALQDS
jgi:hypothetical protein